MSNDTKSPEIRALITTYSRFIAFLRNNPEWFAALTTAVELDTPPDALTFEMDDARYTAVREAADAYLASARYGHCASCYQPVAIYAAHKLDYPEMVPHECGGLGEFHRWDKANTAARLNQKPAVRAAHSALWGRREVAR